MNCTDTFMVNNMKVNEITKACIERIFENIKIEYEYIDLEDDDLNYLISFNTSRFGKLKVKNDISGILYLSAVDNTLNMMVLNIYKLSDADDINAFYKYLNNLNQKVARGRYTIDDNSKQIIYRVTSNCGDEFEGLNEDLISLQLTSFMYGLEDLINWIAKEKEVNGKE